MRQASIARGLANHCITARVFVQRPVTGVVATPVAHPRSRAFRWKSDVKTLGLRALLPVNPNGSRRSEDTGPPRREGPDPRGPAGSLRRRGPDDVAPAGAGSVPALDQPARAVSVTGGDGGSSKPRERNRREPRPLPGHGEHRAVRAGEREAARDSVTGARAVYRRPAHEWPGTFGRSVPIVLRDYIAVTDDDPLRQLRPKISRGVDRADPVWTS